MASLNFNSKRRRLEKSAATLSKPFKSPLRRQIPAFKEEGGISLKDKENSPLNSTIQNATNGEKPTPVLSTESVSHTNNPFPTLPSPLRKRRVLDGQLTPSKKALLSNPEVLNLQKQQMALQSRLSVLRSELDTAKQALRIESSNRAEELEGLIIKWKTASQKAAEEVFAGAQERINGMGGIKVWREKLKNDSTRWEQEEMESWFGNPETEGADLDVDELEALKAEMREYLDETREKHEDGVVEPEEFTMDMMLKTMNIDLKTIGFDRSLQTWVKGS